MSDSLQLHGRQPTRLLCPWGLSRQEYWSGLLCPPQGDLLNPGIEPRSPNLQVDSLPPEPPRKPEVGYQFSSVAQSCPTLCDTMDYSPPGSSVHGDSPGKYTEVDCHALLQGIFPTQGSNPALPHCRRILYQLSHKGSMDTSIKSFTRLTYRKSDLQSKIKTFYYL